MDKKLFELVENLNEDYENALNQCDKLSNIIKDNVQIETNARKEFQNNCKELERGIIMKNNVKDDDMLMVIVGHKEKKEFETKLNEFLKENEDMLLKNHVFFRNSLQAVPHIMNIVIPNLNEKIDEYNNDFDEQFLLVTPIVNKNSQNSFTINFTAQNKQVTYDFDEMYNKLVNFKGNYDLESDMAKELGLYEFVTSIEDELYTEWDKAIDNCHFSESLDDVVEHELG